MNRLFIKIIQLCGAMILFITGNVSGDRFPLSLPEDFSVNPKQIVLHHPVKTDQNLAQLYFDQGLSFAYAFNQDAAYWSFKKASEIDPDMAMAYWGMAFALGPNLNVKISFESSKFAFDIIQAGIQKFKNSPENEKDYIQALAKRFSHDEKKNQGELAVDYSLAMQKLHQKYLDDPDAAVLYAASLLEIDPRNQWSPDGKPLKGTLEAMEILQSVLRKHPDHAGANHYYIHAVEDSLYPEMALMSADRLRKLQISSGHLLHMSSHIYLLVGDYVQAIRSNLDAIAADRSYIREYGMDGVYPASYLSHNLYYLSRAYAMDGRFEDAMQVANRLKDFYASNFSLLEDEEYYASTPLSILIAFHRWKDILDLPIQTDHMDMTQALLFFGRALAFAYLGDTDQSKEEYGRFLAKRKNLHLDRSFRVSRKNQILDIAQYALEAKVAENQGKSDLAVHLLNKAIEIQSSLRYSEPPNWFYSARMALGGLLLKNQKSREAEIIFREELRRYPRYGLALFGLQESLKAQSKISDIYWVNEEFQKVWQYSSISLTSKEL